MKRFAVALALACALSSTTLAGNIPTSGIVSPPPPPETQQSGNVPSTDYTAPGNIPSVPLTVLLTILDFAF